MRRYISAAPDHLTQRQHLLGDCGFNGEECGIVEMTLINPAVAGGGSSADISYIPP